MATFDVNMDEVIKLTNKLEKLHRSSFPSAVRNTLNDAAFTTKRMVPKVAAQKFTTRQKTFFRAFSTVRKASGWKVNGMVAVTGINEAKGSKIAKGLEAQETGGVISGRKLIPHDNARITGSYSKRVSKSNYLKKLTISSKGNRRKGSRHILIKKGGKGTVFKVTNLKTKTRLKPLYIYRNTKKSKVEARPFMRPSAMFAASKIPSFFKNNAEFQFKKVLNR